MSDPNADFQRAMRLRAEGRLEEALGIFEALARALPRLAAPRHLRGLTLCNLGRFDEGLADVRSAVALEPRNANAWSDLGMLLHVEGDADGAARALRRALAVEPRHPQALANLSLVLRAAGDFAGAERACREALAVQPALHEARINLAIALLAQGKFREAWPAHDARPDPRVNLRDPHQPMVVAHAAALPAPPAPVVIRGEQGLGDVVFFLRFVPELRRRGHRLAFWGDARLRPILEPTGLFEHYLRDGAVPAEGLAVVWAGDLPGMLGADEPSRFPAPLALPADAERVSAVRARLEGLGKPPYIGLTWRGGLPKGRLLALSKEVGAEVLARTLRGLPGTFVSLQRQPRPGEVEAFAEALGTPVHDAGAANERLEDALAWLTALDDYIGVSNTNVHLRAGTGRGARVLVPWPPEWRWWGESHRSVWFPAMSVYRQRPDGDWGEALARLRGDLAAG